MRLLRITSVNDFHDGSPLANIKCVWIILHHAQCGTYRFQRTFCINRTFTWFRTIVFLALRRFKPAMASLGYTLSSINCLYRNCIIISSQAQIRPCGSFFQNFLCVSPRAPFLLSLSLPLSFSSSSYFLLSPSRKIVIIIMVWIFLSEDISNGRVSHDPTILAKKIVTSEIFTRLIRSAIEWYHATSTSICNVSSRRAEATDRVDVEPKLDIARYHMIEL